MARVEYALAYKTAQQSVGTSLAAQVFGAELHDSIGIVNLGTSTSRFTVPAGNTGKYGSFAGALSNSASGIWIEGRRGGASYMGRGGNNYSATRVGSLGNGVLGVCAPVLLTDAEYYESYVRANVGGGTQVELGECWSQLEIRDDTFNGALVSKSVQQTFTTNTEVIVTFDTEQYDLDSWHDNVTNNTRFTVPDGVSLVRVSGSLEETNTSASVFTQLYPLLNGNRFIGGFASRREHASGRKGSGMSAPIAVTPGDYFELAGYSSGGTNNISATDSTWFAIEELDSDLSYALVTRSTDQAFTTPTQVPVEWNVETVDTDGWFDVSQPSRLTVPAGVDFVRLTGNIQTSDTTGSFTIGITKNGGTAPGLSSVNSSTSGVELSHVFSGILPVEEGDYFELVVSGTSRSVNASNTRSWFAIEEVRVGPAPSTPTIVSISPDEGSELGGTPVTITGTNFLGTTSVKFDGVNATSIVVVNDTTITCVTPAGTVGLVDVEVTNGAGTATLTDGYEYLVDFLEVRVTQVPLLVPLLAIPPVHITQVPLLVVSLPLQGSQVTQVPTLVTYASKPIPLPLPIVPEIPVTEVWQWLTILTVSDGGQEQRSALRGHPRVNMAFNAVMLDDSDRRDVYQMLFKYVNTTFNYPMYSHSVQLDAEALAGATDLYFDPTGTDVRAGEALAIYDPFTGKTSFYTILSVALDGVSLASPLEVDAPVYCQVCPAPTFRTQPMAGFSMNSIDGEVEVELLGVSSRTVKRPDQSNVLLTMVDGMLLLNKRPLANSPVDENFDQDTEWLDNRIAPPVPRTNWYTPFISGERVFLIHRPAGMDYWRAVADYLKGRQNPFLLPTYRHDLPLLSQPALNATIIVSTNVQFFDFWRSKAWRYVMIQSKAGTIVRKVAEVTVNYDPSGNPVSSNIKLTASIGNTAGSNENMIISFVNTCRLGLDEMKFEHGPVDSYLSIQVRGIEE